MDADEVEQGETVTFWEDLYRSRPQAWSGKVNPVLATEVADLPPGTVLDLGCGEGGDAIWFAERGWRVTAVDVSQLAIDRGRARADELGLTDHIEWVRVDLGATVPGGPFDLVSAQFLQSPIEFPRADVLAAAARAVAPGGSLVTVSHAAFPPGSQHEHSDLVLPTPERELADLQLAEGEWDVVRAEIASRQAQRDGKDVTLEDTVVHVRRHPA